jgi:hypothetical protein
MVMDDMKKQAIEKYIGFLLIALMGRTSVFL